MCSLKKQDMELLKNQKIFNNLSKTDIKNSLSFISFLFILSLTIGSEQDCLFFANIRTELQSIRSSDKNLLPKLTNQRIVSQCNSPPSSLLTKVKKFTLHLLKVGAFSGLIYISIFRIRIVPKAGIQPTSSFASIGTSISSNICASSEPLLNEQMEKNNHNTVFVVNPLFDLGMNAVQPAQPVLMHYEIYNRQTSVVFRGPGVTIRRFRSEQYIRVTTIRTHAQLPRQAAQIHPSHLKIPRGLPAGDQNTLQEALRLFNREVFLKYPHLDIDCPEIKVLPNGQIEVSLNGYTSIQRYTANKEVNANLKKFIQDMVLRNPTLFEKIVLTMEKSEADHLLTSNFSDVLGMDRNKMGTVLLHPTDHKTKSDMKHRYRRPLEIEDIVDWIYHINGETKKHFEEMSLKGKLTDRLDLTKLNKALDKCAENDITLFKTTQFYHSKGTGETSDMLRTLDSSTANIKAINIKLFQAGESGNNKLSKYKLAINMKDFFQTQKAVAAFCYESQSKPLHGCFTTRVSNKIQEFKQECYVYFTEGSRRLGDQIAKDPEILESYRKFEDILHGKGEYNTIIGGDEFATLLFNGRDPYASGSTSREASYIEQPSDRYRDVRPKSSRKKK